MRFDLKKTATVLLIPAIVLLVFGYALTQISGLRGSNEFEDSPQVFRDWNTIKRSGKLIALTDNSSTGYFLYKGRPMGFEYELLKAFAEHHQLKLDIQIAQDMDMIFEDLRAGNADIAAANLTITHDRLSLVNFTEPLLETRQVLVQRGALKPKRGRKVNTVQEASVIKNPLELANKKVHVRKRSSFFQRLRNLSEEMGNKIRIVEAPGHYETEMLIEMVARAEIDYTVADENVAMINKAYYPNLDISTPISFPQKIAWAIRKNSPGLEDELNTWLSNFKETRRFKIIYNRYFHDNRNINQRAESRLFTPKSGRVSEYDSVFKVQAKRLGWDWRLLASLVYQESRFNHEARSWAGAVGIMQLMPATATALGVDSTGGPPAEQIRGGVNYLIKLDKMWQKSVKDEAERIKFVMASYNVGPGHVIDARNLARKFNKSDTTWKDVSVFLFLKSQPRFYQDPVCKSGYCRGSEPVRYVTQILERYEHYQNLINS